MQKAAIPTRLFVTLDLVRRRHDVLLHLQSGLALVLVPKDRDRKSRSNETSAAGFKTGTQLCLPLICYCEYCHDPYDPAGSDSHFPQDFCELLCEELYVLVC